ncbi:MAG: alcohol dehydrogenase catalytic domain-containing protein [Actinobacteria bacterium]|nr:alcohol dehydrogenase catalytic domain-containing protein [Actinomycetota bacterium]
MKAVALDAPGSLAVIDLPDPTGDGGITVQLRAAGVCGTELHILDGMIPPPSFPFVLGHEGAGVVSAVPAGSRWNVGDRVAIYNLIACGTCHWCRTGREEVCTDSVGQLGFNLDGTFRDALMVPEANLVALPDNVSFEDAALLSCSGMTAVHVTRLANVSLGETALVDGIGGVGLMVIQACAAAGASVIGIADSDSKAELAIAAGARDVIVLGPDSFEAVPDAVKALTGGEGADHYFELVGTSASITAGIRSLRRHGAAVLIGYTSENIDIHPIELILSETRILSSVAASRNDLETAVALCSAGKMSCTIDTRYPLDQAGTALDRLRARAVLGRNVLVWE